MAAKKSYAIPASRITPYEDKQIRESVAAEALNRLKLKSAIGADESQAAVRDIMPNTDLNTYTNDNWSSPAYTANTLATLVNNYQLPTTKALGIYAVSVYDANPVVSYINFAPGSNAGVVFRYFLQQCYAEEVTKIYFSEPVFFDPQDFMFIQVMPLAAKAAGEKLVLHGIIAEVRGPNLT